MGILLITVVCFSANTQGSPRTRRALPPGYLSIPGHTECLESQTLPGDSHSGKCIPAIKPAYCSEAAWADLALDSGLSACYGGIEAIPVLRMHLLQEEQPQQIVNFHSPTTTELITSALITKQQTIEPGAKQLMEDLEIAIQDVLEFKIL